jgi:CheY-like chemotaxis protein
VFVAPHGTVVLVVDDEYSIVETLAEVLAWEGYEVLTASNGAQALEVMRARPVGVVLLDVMMPILGGPEVVDAMRTDPELRAVPVVLMTAAPSALVGIAIDSITVLRKPFQVNGLLSALREAAGRTPRNTT